MIRARLDIGRDREAATQPWRRLLLFMPHSGPSPTPPGTAQEGGTLPFVIWSPLASPKGVLDKPPRERESCLLIDVEGWVRIGAPADFNTAMQQ